MGQSATGSGKANGKRVYPRARRKVELSAVEREAWALRTATDPPMTWMEMSRQLKKDHRACKRAYERAVRKMPDVGDIKPAKGFETDDPDKYAEFIAELAHPDNDEKSVSKIAERLNIPYQVAYSVAKRLRSVHFPTVVEARAIKTDFLRDLWGMRAEEALMELTPERMKDASPRDLAIIGGIATEKFLLLKGLPTQIIKTEAQRTKLDVLAQAFMTEVKRRGYEVDVDTATGEVGVTFTGYGKVQDRKEES